MVSALSKPLPAAVLVCASAREGGREEACLGADAGRANAPVVGRANPRQRSIAARREPPCPACSRASIRVERAAAPSCGLSGEPSSVRELRRARAPPSARTVARPAARQQHPLRRAGCACHLSLPQAPAGRAPGELRLQGGEPAPTASSSSVEKGSWRARGRPPPSLPAAADLATSISHLPAPRTPPLSWAWSAPATLLQRPSPFLLARPDS